MARNILEEQGRETMRQTERQTKRLTREKSEKRQARREIGRDKKTVAEKQIQKEKAGESERT